MDIRRNSLRCTLTLLLALALGGASSYQANAQVDPSGSVDLANGLQAHYQFENSYLDSSGNNRHGQSGSTAPTFSQGAIGLAMDVRDIDAWAELPPILNDESACSISMIVRIDSYVEGNSTVGVNVMFAEELPAVPDIELGIFMRNSGASPQVLTAGINGFANLSDLPAPWLHLVFVYDSATGITTTYRDGLFASSLNLPPGRLCGTGGGGTLGALNFNGTMESFYDGMLDEFRFYDRALNVAEVDALYSEFAVILLDGFESGSANAWE